MFPPRLERPLSIHFAKILGKKSGTPDQGARIESHGVDFSRWHSDCKPGRGKGLLRSSDHESSK